jgi:hypothetical protein
MDRKNRNRFQPCVEALEVRELRAGSLSALSIASVSLATPSVAAYKTILPVNNASNASYISISNVNDQSIINYLQSPQYTVPQLSSLPGSPHTLYLNFTGDSRADWFYLDSDGTTEHHYSNVQMGVFDTDGNTKGFSDTEKQQITEIWARVAEAYAPYDVNVTTIDPGNRSNGKTLMVDIGKSNNWLGSGASGMSSIGNFTSAAPNVVFDFCDKFASYVGGPNGPLDTAKSPNFIMQVADTAVHESGHGFGLLHDRVYNPDHSVSNEYDPGNGNWTPFMGNNLTAARHTWTLGIVNWNDDGTPVLQWEPGKLGSVLGYRADDFGDDSAHATALAFNLGGTATVKGVIGYHPPSFLFEEADVDVFKITSQQGAVSVAADVLGYTNGAILDARVELWSTQGMIAAATAPVGGNARLTANVAGGTYYVKVMSGGGLTDAGQYTLTVNRPGTSLSDILTTKQARIVDLIGGTSDAIVGGNTLALDTAKFVPITLTSNLDEVASAVGLIGPGQTATDADVAALATLAKDGKLPATTEAPATPRDTSETILTTNSPDNVNSDSSKPQVSDDATLAADSSDSSQLPAPENILANNSDPAATSSPGVAVDTPSTVDVAVSSAPIRAADSATADTPVADTSSASPSGTDAVVADSSTTSSSLTDSPPVDVNQGTQVAAKSSVFAATVMGVVDTTSLPPATLDALFAGAAASDLAPAYLV